MMAPEENLEEAVPQASTSTVQEAEPLEHLQQETLTIMQNMLRRFFDLQSSSYKSQ